MVVKDGGRVIGTARVLFPAPGVAKIERMAILRPFRRKGIGSSIISFLNTELKNRQIRKAVLHAQCSSVAFYKSCGFVESGLPFNEAALSGSVNILEVNEVQLRSHVTELEERARAADKQFA